MKNFSIFALILMPLILFSQNNIGINTTNPDATAALDVTSTSQGMLIPRMTQAQRDLIGGGGTPATGLLVYQTDNTPGFYFYNGSAWTSLNGGGGSATTDASALTTGTLADARLSSNVTQQGNTFNGANQLVKANSSGLVDPADLGTGSATTSTYLRGDGSWATPNSSGVTLQLVATNTATAPAQTIAGGNSSTPPVTVSFATVSVAPTAGTWNGTTFTANTAGVYMVTANIAEVTNAIHVIPSLVQAGSTSVTVYGVSVANVSMPAPPSRAFVQGVFSMAANDTLVVKASNTNTTAQTFTSDGTMRITIVKLQ